MSHNLKMSVDKARHLRDVCTDILQHLGEHSRTLDRGLAAENLHLRSQVEALTELLKQEQEGRLNERLQLQDARAENHALAQRVTVAEGKLELVRDWLQDDWSDLVELGHIVGVDHG